MGEVYIAGAAMTRVGRREESLLDLMAEAGRGALADAELERPESWKEFSRSPAALALRKANRWGAAFNELGETLQPLARNRRPMNRPTVRVPSAAMRTSKPGRAG